LNLTEGKSSAPAKDCLVGYAVAFFSEKQGGLLKNGKKSSYYG
jgi:hypothetical protein